MEKVKCADCNIKLNKRDYTLVIEKTYTYQICYNCCGERK